MRPARRIHSWRIAVPVRTVVVALRGKVVPARGLRELPYIDEVQANGGRPERRKSATWRRRSDIVGHPIADLAAFRIVADVLSCDYGFLPVFRRNSGTINPGAKSRGRHCIHPGVDVRLLLGEHASALFDVEKNDGAPGKSFACSRSRGCLPVRLAHGCGIPFELFVESPIEKHEKS